MLSAQILPFKSCRPYVTAQILLFQCTFRLLVKLLAYSLIIKDTSVLLFQRVLRLRPGLFFTGGELPRDGVRHSRGALPHQPRKRSKQICKTTAKASGLKIHRTQVCRAYFFLQAHQGGAAGVRRCRPPGLGRGNGGVRPAKSSGQFHAGNIGWQLKKKLFLMQPGQKQNGGFSAKLKIFLKILGRSPYLCYVQVPHSHSSLKHLPLKTFFWLNINDIMLRLSRVSGAIWALVFE